MQDSIVHYNSKAKIRFYLWLYTYFQFEILCAFHKLSDHYKLDWLDTTLTACTASLCILLCLREC